MFSSSSCRVGKFAALLAITLTGCATSQRSTSYERVAKEWSRAIRASQVIPTYPLTQDLQPGDMFIVDVPSDAEQELWDDKGYLPLGYHFGRLHPPVKQYAEFYDNDFGMTEDGRRPPALYRILPTAEGETAAGTSGWTPTTTPAGGTPTSRPSATTNPIPKEERSSRQNWDLAPFAAFPSYSVEITQQGGFNVGLPVQGVPIALGFMGSTRATATVSLKEAYTYGLDNERIWEVVKAAYSQDTKPNFSDKLKPFRPRYVRDNTGKTNVRYRFLRVITRVYHIGAVDVSVNDSNAAAGDLGVGTSGLARNINLLSQFKDKQAVYTDMLGALNKGLAGKSDDAKDTKAATQPSGDAKPAEASQSPSTTAPAIDADTFGARVKVLSVSESAVTLREKFDKPLVVGYLAIDIPIGIDGRLSGLHADTFKRLSSMRRQELGDVGDEIQLWCSIRPDCYNTIEDWGQINAKWLYVSGFPEFAEHHADDRYEYIPGSLQYHFAKGKLKRLMDSVREPLRYIHTPWRALYDRLANEIVYAPEGVLDQLLPTSAKMSEEETLSDDDRKEREKYGYRTDHLLIFRSFAPVLDDRPVKAPPATMP